MDLCPEQLFASIELQVEMAAQLDDRRSPHAEAPSWIIICIYTCGRILFTGQSVHKFSNAKFTMHTAKSFRTLFGHVWTSDVFD